MQVDVNGTRLRFDVVGSSLRPVGPRDGAPSDGAARARRPGELRPLCTSRRTSTGWRSLAQVVVRWTREATAGPAGTITGRPGASKSAQTICTCFFAALDITEPVVVGHSMGGPIALLHAIRYRATSPALPWVAVFGRWDKPRLVEGFRRVAGDEVAAIAARSHAGHAVSEEEWARVYALVRTAASRPGAQGSDAEATRRSRCAAWTLVRRVDIPRPAGRRHVPRAGHGGDLDPATPVTASEEIVGRADSQAVSTSSRSPDTSRGSTRRSGCGRWWRTSWRPSPRRAAGRGTPRTENGGVIRRIDLRGTAGPVDYRAVVPRAELDVETAGHAIRPVLEAIRTRGVEAVLEYGATVRRRGPRRRRRPSGGAPEGARRPGPAGAGRADGVDPPAARHVRGRARARRDDRGRPGGSVTHRRSRWAGSASTCPAGWRSPGVDVVMNVVPAQVAGVGSHRARLAPPAGVRRAPAPTILAAARCSASTR